MSQQHNGMYEVFFFQWLTSCPSDRCCFLFEWLISSTNQLLCLFLKYQPFPPRLWVGPWSFRTIPLVPSSMSHLQVVVEAYAKLQFRGQGIVQSLLQSHPEETQFGWFCRNGLKDGKTWNCFFSRFPDVLFCWGALHLSSRTCHKSCWLELSRSSSVGYGEQQLSLLCNAYARLEVLSGGWRQLDEELFWLVTCEKFQICTSTSRSNSEP